MREGIEVSKESLFIQVKCNLIQNNGTCLHLGIAPECVVVSEPR